MAIELPHVRETKFDTPKRMPYPSRPKPEISRTKAVTIIAGFRCLDGVVVCADQLVTRGDSKYYEEKIKVLLEDNLTLVFAGAWDFSLTKEVFEKIIANLEEESPEGVKESAERVLTDMGRFPPVADTAPLAVEFLIAACSRAHKAQLFAFSGKGLYTVNDYAFGGIGDSSLVRFLCKNLFLRRMTIGGTQLLGTYLVKKAKDYVTGCGGPTDVFAVCDGGRLEQLDISVTAELERKLDEHEADVLPMLLSSLALPIGPITRL